jgi:hypothetical protein
MRMPIVVVTFTDDGVTTDQRREFILSLLGHRVFTRSRANAKAREGVKAAVAKLDGNVMRLAETDHDCLKIAADTPEHEVYEATPQGPRLKGYEDGYQLTGRGVEAFMATIDAIMNGVVEKAEEPKAETAVEAQPLKALP